MECKDQDKSQILVQWQSLLAALRQSVELSHHHQLLIPLRNCVKFILANQVELFSYDIQDDLNLLLNVCKRLDDIAYEKNYREQLAHFIIDPLIKALRTHAKNTWLLMFENYVRQHISYGSYGEVRYNTLCDHQLPLMDLHQHYVSYLQANPEQYDQAAIVIRVIDYWRQLKRYDPLAFERANIEPLKELSEYLFVFVQKSESQLQNKELWRLILLLQILLVDHPHFEISPQSSNCTLLKDYKPVLTKTRDIFFRKEVDVMTAQRKHTMGVVLMLQAMLKSVIAVLGEAPCDLAICVLGSTSRYDRRPYSDVELMILHSGVDQKLTKDQRRKWEKRVDDYIHHLVCILELMIVRLGETHDIQAGGNAGFHLDSTCHVLIKKTWGTPQGILQRFIKVQSHEPDTHPWLDSEVQYALLQPLLLHSGEFGADGLMKNYHALVADYLLTATSEEDNSSIINKRLGLESNNTWTHGLKRHEAIALVCLYDVVQKSVNSLNSLVANQDVDIKQVYYKPLLYFALNLRLYFNWPSASPWEIMRQYAKEYGLNGEFLTAWWHGAFSYIVRHQIKMHLDSGHQEERMKYPANWTPEELFFWSGLDLINQGFIKPLHFVLSQWFINKSQPFEELIREHTQHSFNERQSWIKKWSERAIDPQVLLTHPLIGTFTQRTAMKGKLENFKVLAEQYSYDISLGIIKASLVSLTQVEIVDAESEDEIINYVLLPYFKNHSEFEPILHGLTNLEDFARFINKIKCSNEIFIRITKYLLNRSGVDKLSCRENAYRWYQTCGGISRQCDAMLIQSDSCGFRLKETVLRDMLEAGICLLDEAPSSDVTLSAGVPEVTIIRRTSNGEQKIRLQNSIIEKIIDFNTGHIKQHPSIERSPEVYVYRAVNFARDNGIGLHFKEHPDFPLMAVFNYLLHMRVMGTGSIPVEIVLFEVKIKYNTLVYPVLISLTVTGKTFKDVLTNSPKLVLSRRALAERMVMDAILHVGDGFPRNYVVPDEVDAEEIICVDGEQIFVNSFSEGGIITKPKLQEISIFYCLPEFHTGGVLAGNLPHDVIVKLSEINVEGLLEDCLNELAQREALDELLYGRYLEQFTNRDIKHPFTGECLLAEGLIGKLTIDLSILKSFAERALTNDVLLTARGVLAICAGQKCANLYFSQKITCSPSEYLQRIAGRTNTMSSSDYSRLYLGSQVGGYNDLRKRQYDINSAKSEIYRCQYVNFSAVKNLGGNIFSPFEKEKTLILDFEGVDNQTAKKQLDRLLNSNICFAQLVVRSCSILTDDILTKLLENSTDTLRLLKLENNQNLSENSLFFLADKCTNLAALFIKDIGIKSVYRRLKSNMFNTLKLLVINKCTNLSWLNILAPKLSYFECKNNTSLLVLSINVPRLLRLRLDKMMALKKFYLMVNSYCDIEVLDISKTCKTTVELLNNGGSSKKFTDLNGLSEHLCLERTDQSKSVMVESSQLNMINIIIIGSDLAPFDVSSVTQKEYQNKEVHLHLFPTDKSISVNAFGEIDIVIIIYEPRRQNANDFLVHCINNIQHMSPHPLPVLLVATKDGTLDININVTGYYFPSDSHPYHVVLRNVVENCTKTAVFFHDIILRQVNSKLIEFGEPFILPKGFYLNEVGEICCKICCLGRRNDKTDHTHRYNTGQYTLTETTIGVDYFVKRHVFNGVQFKILYYNSGAHPAFSETTHMFYKKISLVLLLEAVNDIRQYKEQKSLPFWFSDFIEHGDSTVPCILIGINSKESDREIIYKDAREYAEESGFLSYFECDAKTGHMISEAFEGSFEYYLAHSGFWRWAVMPYSMSKHVVEAKISSIPQKFAPQMSTPTENAPRSNSNKNNRNAGSYSTSDKDSNIVNAHSNENLDVPSLDSDKSTLDIVNATTEVGLFSPHEIRKALSKEKILLDDEGLKEDEESFSIE